VSNTAQWIGDLGIAGAFATVALSGAVFMIRFLVALLRECKPPGLPWIMRRKSEDKNFALAGSYQHLDRRDDSRLVFLDPKSIVGLERLPLPSHSRRRVAI
jgi:hypothetical protein